MTLYSRHCSSSIKCPKHGSAIHLRVLDRTESPQVAEHDDHSVQSDHDSKTIVNLLFFFNDIIHIPQIIFFLW